MQMELLQMAQVAYEQGESGAPFYVGFPLREATAFDYNSKNNLICETDNCSKIIQSYLTYIFRNGNSKVKFAVIHLLPLLGEIKGKMKQ